MSRLSSTYLLCGAAAALLAAPVPARAEVRRAVLVGIDKYLPAGAPPAAATPAGGAGRSARGGWSDLDGAVNDVEAIRQVLVSRFGFKEQDVHVLTNAQASRDGIVGAIRTWLIEAAAPGDVSLFYYAGHGSQVKNSMSAEADKMDESLVPADAHAGQPDLRDKELARLFGQALDRKVVLTAILDSCHSGSIARGVGKPRKSRTLPPDERDVADPSAPPVPPETRGALILSAAQDFQVAAETADDDSSPHGLFTWAFLKVLRSMPVNESADRMFLQLRAIMQAGDTLQEPVMAGIPDRRRAPLFGVGRPADTGAVVVAAQAVQADGSVLLQGGVAAGIRVGTELRRTGDAAGGALTLRVIKEQGLTRTVASAIAGTTTGVRAGALFEVTKWSAPSGPALHVWIGTGVPLPPGVTLSLGDGSGSIQVLASAEGADYVLTGRRTGDTLEYAWTRPVATPDGAATMLPVRTNWVPLGSDPRALATSLQQYATRLAAIRTWLQLESPPDTGRFPYQLALRNSATQQLLTDGEARQGDRYGLVLSLDEAMAKSGKAVPRYVYVFALDSTGKTTLLFPTLSAGSVENHLPATTAQGGALPAQIPLGPAELFAVGPPLGTDTYVMVTSETALPDPGVLEGEAVASRGLTPNADPLSRLLGAASVGQRGLSVTTPTNWSVQRLTIRSVAK